HRVQNILYSITDAFTVVDRDWTIRMVNRQAEKILGSAASDLIGANLWEKLPALIGSPFEAACRKAMDDGVAHRVEEIYPPLDKWLEVNVYPSEDGLTLLYRDVTERVHTAQALRDANR